MDEKGIRALEALQRGLLVTAQEKRITEGRDMCVGLDLVAASVPHVAGLIQSRLPKADAEIYSQARMCEVLREFAQDIFAVQRRIAEQTWKARKRTRSA